MPGYLICEDGPLSKWVFTFDEGDNWIIGRDGDLCTFVLEDPMVSRKHLTIFFEDNSYFVQNESSTNPALLNDSPLEEKTKINEDDLVQIGNNTFRFSLTLPQKEEIEIQSPPEEEIKTPLTLGHFATQTFPSAKWMIKVISGPSAGATFPLELGQSFVIGSDTQSDILLHDVSISKTHARITISKTGETAIIDLKSRNGVLINGKKIDKESILKSLDQITLGNTSIVFLDMDQSRDTIYSPGITNIYTSESTLFDDDKQVEESKNWKETFIPTKHLAVASVFSVFICIAIISVLALFRSTKVDAPTIDVAKQICLATCDFKTIEFNYNTNTSTLFLTGHVLNEINYNDLTYRLNNIPYIATVDDNVIIDSIVCNSINSLLLKNPTWQSILMTAREPGVFLLTGYLQNENERANLTDFVNKYFSYLNLLENMVVAEDTLNAQIESMLIEQGFVNVQIQQTNGQLILAGRAHENDRTNLETLIENISHIPGIRVIQNFVIYTTSSSSAIDITSKYTVTGSSKYGNISQFVLINGKILGVNDTLDGMVIGSISNNQILLHQGGVKYKIDFNE